jgi:predicted TIM-barrel fold metal-dependent hydrolase
MATSVIESPVGIVDVDVHAPSPTLTTLEPYLDPTWLEFSRERNWKGPAVLAPVEPLEFAHQAESSQGVDLQGFDDSFRNDVFATNNVKHAIINCSASVETLRHPEWANALVRAINDWLVAEWLERDPRLRASLVVPGRNEADMVAEIERVGQHPGFVQVLMPVRTHRLYGNRSWHPVYEAMVKHDLVMGLHRGGITEGPPSPTGWPSWYVEEYAAELQVYCAQITSMIAEGTFQSFPSLRVSVLEAGFAWAPVWCWRLDADWKGLRREVPWLDRRPSEIFRDHFRLSIAPVEDVPAEEFARVLDWLQSESILMFASDYPRRYKDGLPALLAAARNSMRAELLGDSARSWYRLS